MIDPPTPDPRSARRQAILEAAGRLFITQGFEGTTTLDIARGAGMSKRDLYVAFPSKEAMLEALIAGRVAAMAAGVQLSAPHSRAEVLGTLEGLASRLGQFLVQPEVIGLYRVAIAQAERQPVIGRMLLAAGIDGTTARVRDYLADAVAKGLLRLDHIDSATRVFLSVAVGQSQMRRLLDPSAAQATASPTTAPADAVRCLLALETG